jgi:hypothetical protein
MGALNIDLEAQVHAHRGKAAGYRGMGDAMHEQAAAQAAATHRAADDMYRKADREDRKADKKTRRLVALAITEARNEEMARAAVLAPAEEDH